jgi:hypothetical protein
MLLNHKDLTLEDSDVVGGGRLAGIVSGDETHQDVGVNRADDASGRIAGWLLSTHRQFGISNPSGIMHVACQRM